MIISMNIMFDFLFNVNQLGRSSEGPGFSGAVGSQQEFSPDVVAVFIQLSDQMRLKVLGIAQQL